MVQNTQPEVILSFDDGPTPYLEPILSILNEENVQGLFFWQTKLINKRTPWKHLLETGHRIGSHAHSHRILSDLSFKEQFYEIKHSQEKLKSLIGCSICWFRPPHGLYNEDTMTILKQLEAKMILWQIASWDWKHPKDEEKIIENVLENVGSGDIILLHELPQTVEILPKLIRGIREKGLKLTAPHTTLKLES